jgi:hypothetical protein
MWLAMKRTALLRVGNIITSKDMANFESKYFDEGSFKKDLQEQETTIAHFNDAVEKLNNEGIPTDYDFIMKLSKSTDEDYLEYIKGTFQEYIGSLKLVVKTERKRIAALYDEIYSNTLPCVQYIRTAFSKGLFIAKGRDGFFTIDREKMNVTSTLSYDTMLLSSESAECTAKNYTAEDADIIKKNYRKSHLFDALILEPIMDFFLDGGIVFGGLLLLLGIFVSWPLAGAALAELYVLDVVLNFIGDKTSDICCKKFAKVKPEKEELYALLESENIKTFYANPERRPWDGNVERD